MAIHISGGGRRIRASGKDAHALFAAMARPLDVDTANPATCVGCGCTDDKACPGGCWWLAVDRDKRTGVCSSCAPKMDAYRAGDK